MDSNLWATIRRLFEVEKLSKSAIAVRLGIHRWTVRRALASPHGPPVNLPRKNTERGKLIPHRAYIETRLTEYPELSANKIFREIVPMGYLGGYSGVKKYIRRLRAPAPKAFLRLETLPGEFAQVDWANIGTVPVGNAHRKLSCFVMVLSYSRMLYLEFTLSQCMEDFLACHVNAFHFFGGVPKKINYDNLKTVVLARIGRNIQFHPRFLDFSGVHLFEPIPCNIRAGWEKGKVENGIKYIRSAFLAGRLISSWAQIQKEAVLWRDQEANLRVHGTTRERPLDRFATEKPLLQPLPPQPYDTAIIRSVKPNSQALFHFESNRYSVPCSLLERDLTLKVSPHTLEIFDGLTRVAHHLRSYESHLIIANPHHYEGLLAQRKKAQATKTQESFLALRPEAKEYLAGLMATELHVQSHLAKIQKLIVLYGKSAVASALLHALNFKAFGAGYIQRIILQQRAAKNMPEPQPIILSRKPQWNQLAVEQTDLAIYDQLFDHPNSSEVNP